MKIAHYLSALLPVTACAALLLLDFSYARLPGGLLPGHPQLAPVTAAPSASVTATDGSVFVLGDFTAVNGVPQTGLAKLAPDGRLVERFKPQVSFSTDDELWIYPGGLSYMPSTLILPRLFVTVDGTLLVPRSERLLAFDPDGSIDPRFDAMNDSSGRLRPLLESDGRILFERDNGGTASLEVRRSDDLTLIDPPGFPPSVSAILDAAPAGDGKFWILARTAPSSGVAILRLNPDLTPETDLEPIEPTGGNNHWIRSAPGGGFLLTSDLTPYGFWPQPSSTTISWQWYSKDGEIIRSESSQHPIGSTWVADMEAGGSILRSAPSAEGPLLVREFADGSLDPGFETPLSANQVEVLADGRIRHSHIHRVLANGSPDPAWNVPVLTAQASVETFGVLPDGRLVVGRVDASFSGHAFSELLLLDSSLDLQPAPWLAAMPRFRSASITPDGAVLLLLSADHAFADGTKTRLLRVLPDSGIDPNSPRYLSVSDDPIFPYPLTVSGMANSIYQVRPLPGRRYLVEIISHGGDVISRRMVRLLPNGSPDPGFVFNGSTWFGAPASILADGSFIIAGKYYAPNGSELGPMPFGHSSVAAETNDGWVYLFVSTGNDLSRIVRWDPVSGVDRSFESPFTKGTSITRVTPVGSGKLVVTGHLLTRDGVEKMVRLHPDGRLDPSFKAEPLRRLLPLVPWTTGVLRGGEILDPEPTNRLLSSSPRRLVRTTWLSTGNQLVVSGDFTHLGNEPRPAVAALDLGGPWTFAEWTEAWFPGTPPDPERDSDGDGAADYHEFMVGSDPTRADQPPGLRVLPGSWPAFHLPLDPDALGPDPILELSTDLASWHDARADQVIIWSFADGITWWPLGSSPTVFGRARMSENP